MNDMTEAQGRFLTTLLDRATAKDAHAGTVAREATRELWAEERMTKACASAWIDVLKRFTTSDGTAAAQAVQRQVEAARSIPRQWTRPAGAPLSAARPTRTLPTQPTGMVVEPSDREQRMLARLGATPVTDSVREAVGAVRVAKRTVGAEMGSGFDIRRSLRNWTPGNAATRAEAGF